MNEADIALGMSLKQQAGWNQLEADWHRALELEPEGCFVAELDGVPVATTTNCTFGDTAWVAMVLVAENVRGQGIGKALLRHSLYFLDQKGVRTVQLHATPMGKPLYEKLGFVLDYPLTRYVGNLQANSTALTLADIPPTADEINQLVALDREITGADRGKLLRKLFSEKPDALRIVRTQGQVEGYATVRERSSAWQLGPCLGSQEAAARLLADYGQRFAGQRVFADIPDANVEAVRWAVQGGLTAQRPLLRMYRGDKGNNDTSRIHCSFGPEKG